MDARLSFNSSGILQRFVKRLSSAGAAVPQGTLPLATVNLVLAEASQIHGCAVCVDMPTKDAEHTGETSARLNFAVINAYDRLSVICGNQGEHQPGRWR